MLKSQKAEQTMFEVKYQLKIVSHKQICHSIANTRLASESRRPITHLVNIKGDLSPLI